MPTGIYERTEKHSFNKGRKHPNRKKYFKGITQFEKLCPFCKCKFTVTYKNKKNIFCSRSCSSKSHADVLRANIKKVDRNKQKKSASERRGEKHPRWIKDRTKLKDDSLDRGGQRHRDWSRSVKNRDKWQCRMKGSDCSGRLESHHIIGWKDSPELRYELSNGITLCHYHHPRKREEERRLIPYFKSLLKLV